MSVTRVLLDILVVLLAAKAAAEVAERVGVPAVVGRTVRGAAVADDVLGLVILTVVVRLVSAGGVSPLEVVGVVAVATAFIVLTSVMGVRIAPQLFAFVARYSRSSGTLVA